MDKVVMELDNNTGYNTRNVNKTKSKQLNLEMVKQEAPTVDNISLELLPHEGYTSKLENVSTEYKSESTSIFDPDVISNKLFNLKSEMVMQDCKFSTKEKLSVKQELLHEELDIKCEDEAIQQIIHDDTDNWGNQLPNRAKPFKCLQCDYTCGYKNHLQRHLRTHTGKKPFKCNICDFSGRDNSSLKLHMRTHTGEKPFKCHICNYSCGLNANLKRHLRTHTGEKPFKCSICDYSCRDKNSLKLHLITHTGGNPRKCNICNYSSAHSGNWNRHLRSHSREKPFKCNICNYSCGHNIKFKYHLKTHTVTKS